MTSRIAHVTAAGASGATSAAIDTTGASLLVVNVGYGAAIAVSDSKGNTWIAGTEQVRPSVCGRLYYAWNPVVGTGHTFTVTGAGAAPSFEVAAFDGVDTSANPLEAQQGAAVDGVSAAGVGSGTLTPVSANNLIISGVAHSAAITGFAAQAGFTTSDQVNFASGSNYGSALGYLVQAAATPIPNSTVVSSWTGSVNVGVMSMAFKATAGGPSVPVAPTIGTATAGNTSATVAYTLNGNGGSAITGVTATSSPGGLTGSVSGSGGAPITVSGLTNGTAYTFTVHATNAIGNSAESAASNSVTPTSGTTVPGAPTIGSATAGNAQATVTFTAPGSNGGSAITGYTATSTPGGITGSISGATAAPITVTGLTNGTAYTFTVHATNAIGNSAESGASNSATPSAGGGLPVPGVASLVSATPTTLNLSATAASGGTAPLTYQWHRSTTANFTPNGGTAISGATSLTLANSAGLSQGVPYYYKLRVTDAGSLTADSNQVAGSLRLPDLNLGGAGDSITNQFGLSAGQGPLEQAAVQLRVMGGYRNVNVVNRGINGASTADWLSGSSNLNNAKTAFAAGGVTHVHIMLGANDAAAVNLRSAAAYKANLQNIITDLTGAGYKVILSYPTYIPAGANSNATTAASVALAQSYQAEIDSLINNTTVLRGDTQAFNAYMDNLAAWYQADMTHPNVAGAQALGSMWARAMHKAIYENTAPALATRTVSITLKDGSGPLANLTNLQVAIYDEADPADFSAPRYQSDAEITDGAGLLVCSFGSTLSVGGSAGVVVRGADGRHYNAAVVVS